MERLNWRSRSDSYGKRLNREHYPVIATTVPWLSIMLASIVPIFFIATALPLVPPTGFLMLLGWRLVRPGLLPVWAGAPLGLFDDLFSGQPAGFAMVTWSLAMIFIDVIETRMPWRSFLRDWLTAAMLLLLYILAGWALSGGSPTRFSLIALLPQLVLSILIFPILSRFIARLDRLRLSRWKRVA